jgi:preprotein translocase subunit SecG
LSEWQVELESKMGAIGIILLVAFVVVCILLVLIILVQDDGSSGMGGLLGGRGTSAFGSHSASVLTRSTFVLVVLFFILALSLALLNKKPKLQRDLAPAAVEESSSTETQSGSWWKSNGVTNESTAPAEAVPDNGAVPETGTVPESGAKETEGGQN